MSKIVVFNGVTPGSTASSYVPVGEVGPISIKIDGLTGGTIAVQYKNEAGTATTYASTDATFSADGELILTEGNAEIRLKGGDAGDAATGTVYATISGPGVIKED